MIHRFRVQNFKSLIDVSVDLEPMTVLVGKSGTGKSNFVEAIQTLPGHRFKTAASSTRNSRSVAAVSTGDKPQR